MKLHEAILNKDINLLKELLASATPEDLRKTNDEGLTPLHVAAQKGYLEMVELLLDKDTLIIDAREEGGVGSTPLHYAAQSGHLPVFLCLVKRGADLKMKSDNNADLFSWACDGGNIEIVQYLLEMPNFFSSINAVDTEGWMPLHIAAFRGHEQVVKLLLDNGANITANNVGLTPLHRAAFRGHEQIVKLLLAHGADINAVDKDGSTPLHMAALVGHPQVVQLLLQWRGANGNAIDKGGQQDSSTIDTQLATSNVIDLEQFEILRSFFNEYNNKELLEIAKELRQSKVLDAFNYENGGFLNETARQFKADFMTYQNCLPAESEEYAIIGQLLHTNGDEDHEQKEHHEDKVDKQLEEAKKNRVVLIYGGYLDHLFTGLLTYELAGEHRGYYRIELIDRGYFCENFMSHGSSKVSPRFIYCTEEKAKELITLLDKYLKDPDEKKVEKLIMESSIKKYAYNHQLYINEAIQKKLQKNDRCYFENPLATLKMQYYKEWARREGQLSKQTKEKCRLHWKVFSLNRHRMRIEALQERCKLNPKLSSILTAAEKIYRSKVRKLIALVNDEFENKQYASLLGELRIDCLARLLQASGKNQNFDIDSNVAAFIKVDKAISSIDRLVIQGYQKTDNTENNKQQGILLEALKQVYQNCSADSVEQDIQFLSEKLLIARDVTNRQQMKQGFLINYLVTPLSFFGRNKDEPLYLSEFGKCVESAIREIDELKQSFQQSKVANIQF